MATRISENFLAEEFTCNHCGKSSPRGTPPSLLAILEDIRIHFNDSGVVVMSGYRCPEHNARVGGAKHSQHLLGTAADIRVVGASPQQVQAYLHKKYPMKYGIGSYQTFTHIDVRKGYARWRGC